jgi:molybdenum ABC transporter molybdate-binding protein
MVLQENSTNRFRTEHPLISIFLQTWPILKKLQENGKTASEIFPYGIGRLVLWSKKDLGGKLSMEILKEKQIRKIAIANPRHAPYGQRAEETLKHFSLYEQVKPKLVFGENIAQTAQFVGSGAADIGIIALSLALSPNMKKDESQLLPYSGIQSPILVTGSSSN